MTELSLASGREFRVDPWIISDQLENATWRHVTCVSDPTWDEQDTGLEDHVVTFPEPTKVRLPSGALTTIGADEVRLVLHADGKYTIRDEGNSLGGGGTNVAVALARLGVPTSLVGHVGVDDHAAHVTELLKGYGVGVDFIKTVPGAKTRRSHVLPLGDKRRTILTKKYSSHTVLFTIEDLEFPEVRDGIGFASGQRDIVKLSYVVNRLIDSGATSIALNPSKEELCEVRDMKQILAKAALLTANREELTAYAEAMPANLANDQHPTDLDLLRKIQENVGSGAGTLVMTDGKDGSIALDDHFAAFSPMYKNVREAENLPGSLRLGAGDGSAAGWVMNLALTDDLPSDERLRRGLFLAAINSAMVCMAPGASERTLEMKDLETAHSLLITQQEFAHTA
jgi:ribokinase